MEKIDATPRSLFTYRLAQLRCYVEVEKQINPDEKRQHILEWALAELEKQVTQNPFTDGD